jgi:hypothetical protein
MKLRRCLIGLLFLGLAFCSPERVGAQSERTNASPGLAVGAKAPNFVLPGPDGREQSLAALLKKGKVALVFHRSADW